MVSGSIYIVNYRSVFRSLWRYAILPGIFFTIAWASVGFDPFRDLLIKEGRGGPTTYALVFLILGLITSLEILIAVLKIISGRPALRIDKSGLRGWHMWLPRRIDWSEYHTHHRSKDDLILSRKPRLEMNKGLGKIWGMFFGGLSYHIAVPLQGVDKTEAEILAAINQALTNR